MRAWSEALGQPTFVGSSGRVFPQAFKASPLLRAWLRRLDGQGVRLALRHRWVGWDGDGKLLFETPDGRASSMRRRSCWRSAARAGRGSAPMAHGSEMLAAKGVSVAPLRPANSGFTVAWSDIFRIASRGSR